MGKLIALLNILLSFVQDIVMFSILLQTYLVDNRVNADTPISIAKDSHDKWFVMKNQIFLGLLGSTVSPRREAVTFLDLCNRAGVRFRYFSPRNMRRTKGL